MQKGDEASPSIILAGRALLVKMLITLEPHGIFGQNLYTYVNCAKRPNCAKRFRLSGATRVIQELMTMLSLLEK